MRDMTKKKANDAQRHAERMATDIDYRLRKLWHTINARCYSGNGRNDWRYYGGKGVTNDLTVSDLKVLWFRDSAMQMKSPTIDRKDGNGNYTLSNCRFIEHAENLRRRHRAYREAQR